MVRVGICDRYTITEPEDDVEVIVTPITGDADVYVTTSETGIKKPTAANIAHGNNGWVGEFYGKEDLVISHKDDRFCPAGCDLIIGVLGYVRANGKLNQIE